MLRFNRFVLLILASGAELADSQQACFQAVRGLCPATSLDSCLDCASQYPSELASAGCTNESILRNVCQASICVEGFLDVCWPASQSSQQECGQCAQDNIDDLTSAGCTQTILSKLCGSGGGGGGGGGRPVPPTVLPTGATDANPLRVFFTTGQSGCEGQSSVEDFNLDANPSYDELKGPQEGVWIASLHGGAKYQGEDGYDGADGSRFFMTQMEVGVASRNGGFFGPELALGRRLADADGDSAPVLIVKYCWGGSNAESEWNPNAPANSWDRAEDGDTALWLLNNVADLTSKDHLYANFIYTARRSLELLDDAGIPFELSGLFWLQGAADKDRSWEDYGNDLVALFEGFRADLGDESLPIIDTGSGGNHNPRTAKEYAASKVDGCNVVVASMPLGTQNADPGDDGQLCDGGAVANCVGINFPNNAVYEFYGYDTALSDPAYADLKPPGATDKTFRWFKDFPSNTHFEYEADVLQGRTLANTFVDRFTDDALADEWIADDIQIQFPYPACDPAIDEGKPGADNICWMDLRDESALDEATCSVSEIERRKMTSFDQMDANRLDDSGAGRQTRTKVFAASAWVFLATMLLLH